MSPEPAREDRILACLSAGHWRCSVCGDQGGMAEDKEQAQWWVACKCGHVFPVANRITWN